MTKTDIERPQEEARGGQDPEILLIALGITQLLMQGGEGLRIAAEFSDASGLCLATKSPSGG